MSDIAISPIGSVFDLAFTPPGSKSISNRALVLAALGRGVCDLQNMLFADDTHVMIDSLIRLGFRVIVDRAAKSVRVHGASGRVPATQAECFVGNSGTTVRFLTALCGLGKGVYTLDGIARMRERPIGPLVTMLKNLGARIEHLMEPGFPPVRVIGDGLPGGLVRFGAESSSQFLSAVLMAGPYMRNELQVSLDPNQTSWPYVEMTLRLMDEFGVTPEVERDPATGEPRKVIIPAGAYTVSSHTIEPDASNASYFLGLAAIHPNSRMKLSGLSPKSLQGDAKFYQLLKQMGCEVEIGADTIAVTGPAKLSGIDADLSPMPDTAQTLAVVSLFADGPTTMRGLHTLRVKETDRVSALEKELTKLGARVQIEADTMTITPPITVRPAEVDTYDDHRMAMSFALAGTRSAGVVIKDAACVNKTYPEFFEHLRQMLDRQA